MDITQLFDSNSDFNSAVRQNMIDTNNFIQNHIKNNIMNHANAVKEFFEAPSTSIIKGLAGTKDVQNIGQMLNNTKGSSIVSDENGWSYDSNNPDSQLNYLNSKAEREYNEQALDRTIEALRRNGINPALVLGNSASSAVSATTADAQSSSGSFNLKSQVNSAISAAKVLGVVGSLLGAVAALI